MGSVLEEAAIVGGRSENRGPRFLSLSKLLFSFDFEDIIVTP